MHPYLRPSVIEPTIDEALERLTQEHEKCAKIKKSLTEENEMIDSIIFKIEDISEHGGEYQFAEGSIKDAEHSYVKELLYLRYSNKLKIERIIDKETDCKNQIEELKHKKELSEHDNESSN